MNEDYVNLIKKYKFIFLWVRLGNYYDDKFPKFRIGFEWEGSNLSSSIIEMILLLFWSLFYYSFNIYISLISSLLISF
jgi:hypothetical protein